MAQVEPLIDPTINPSPDAGVVNYPDRSSSGSGGFNPLIPMPPDPAQYNGPIQYPDKPNAAHQAYQLTQEVDPDHAAKVLTAAKALGENPAFINSHLDDATRAMNAPTFEDFQKMEKEHPITHAFVSDPDHMAVSKDDLSNLTKNEELIQGNSSIDRIYKTANSATSKMLADTLNVPTVAANMAMAPANQLLHAMGLPPITYGENPVSAMLNKNAAAWSPPPLPDITKQIQAGDMKGAAQSVAEGLAGFAPVLATGLLGGWAPRAVMTGQALVNAYQRNESAGAGPIPSNIDALTHASAAYVLMDEGIFGAFKKWGPALAAEVGQASAKQLIAQTFKTLGLGSAQMSGVMMGTNFIDKYADVATGVNPRAMDDIGRSTISTGLMGLLQGFAFSGAGAAMGIAQSAGDLRRTQQMQDTYAKINENLQAQALYKRAPDMAEDLLQKQVEGTPLETIGIPKDKLQTFFQSSKMDEGETVDNLGIRKQFDAATDNLDVTIPLAKWASVMGKTPAYDGLKDDIRFSSDDPEKPNLTINEAKDAKETAEKGIMQQADQAAKEDPKIQEGRDFIVKDFSDRIKATGQLKGQDAAIQHTAEILAAQYTMAPWRQGQDLKDFYLGNAPDVKKAEGAPADPNSPNILNQGNPDDPRAFISYGQKKVISLVEGKSDASSIVHELGHDWLEGFSNFVKGGQATESHLADWGKLKDWLGIKDDQTGIDKDQHEKFARGFESYLMEGIAPKEELRPAFQRFASWLTKLYGTVSKLGAQLNPDVKGIFDRMLASQNEIDFAHRRIGMDMDVDIPGLDPKVKARLVKLREDARNQAIEGLREKQMSEFSNEHKTMLLNESVKARVQAEDDVKASPVQTAMQAISETFDGKDATQTASKFHNDKINAEDRATFEQLAEARGFGSGSELAYKILQEKPVEDQVNDRVAAHMTQFPEFKDTAEMQQEALRLVHSDKSTELMAQERAIFQNLVQEATGRAAEINLNAAKARIEAKAAKDKASEIIASKPLSEAGQYMPYFTAERNAAIKVSKALMDKDFNEAGTQKRIQMLNHALAAEAMRTRDQAERMTDYMAGVQGKDKALFKGEDHFNQVAALLDRFGMGRKDYDQSTKTETLGEWNTRMVNQNEAVNVSPWLFDESIKKPFKTLTVDEAHDAVNAVKNIQRIANAQQNFYKLMDGANVQNTIVDLKTEAAKFNDPKDAEQIMRRQNTMLEKAKRLIAGYDSNLRNIENIALQLQGWHDKGKWTDVLWKPVEAAADVESNLMKTLNEGYEKLLKDHFTDKERRDSVDYSKATFIPELEQSLRKMDLIDMASNLGNASNRARLFDTPLVGVGDGVPWNEQSVMDVLQKNLTESDWKFVQGRWNLIHSLWPKEEANHKELTGFTPGHVDPMPFTVQSSDGKTVNMDGGYFPLRKDARSNIRAEIQQKIDDPLYTEQNPAWRAVTKTGHLEERQEGTKYPVALDSSIMQRHLRDAVHDIAFRGTIIDLRRLIGNQDFVDTVKSYAGDEQYKALRDWVAGAANGNARDSASQSFWTDLSKSMREKFTTSALMFNPKLLTIHQANWLLFPGAVEGYGWGDMGHALFARGIPFITSSLLRTDYADNVKDSIFEKSAFMRDQEANPEYSIQTTFDKLTGKGHKMSDFFWHYFGSALQLSSIPNWQEAYEKQKTGGASEQDAIAYADTLVRRTVGPARKVETAPIFRGGEIDRTMGAFQTFMNAQQNRWERERGILSQNYAGNAIKFGGYVAAHFGAFAAASQIMSGNMPSLTDPDKMKRWMSSVLLYKFQMMSGVNQVASVIADQALHIPSSGYRPIPQVEAVDNLINTVKKGTAYAQGTGTGQSALESGTHAAAFAMGQPDQFVKLLWNAYDIAFEGMTPKAGDLLRRRPTAERNQ